MTGSLRIQALIDRIVASDPGMVRLRMASAGASAMASSLAVEYGFARLAGADARLTLIVMLLGAVVAMMGSMALSGTGAGRKAKIAVFFPVAAGLGLTISTVIGTHMRIRLVVFVVVMFAAVLVRRFGIPFFFYGFMAWMGYFFASLLKAELAMLPMLLGAVTVSSAWVFLLSATIAGTNPRRALLRTLGAYDAQARIVTRQCGQMLAAQADSDEYRRSLIRLSSRQAALADAALMVEGWAEEPGALPEGWSGPALRRRLIDAQHAIDRIVGAVTGLVDAGSELKPSAERIVGAIAHKRDEIASAAATRLYNNADLASDDGSWHAQHLANAVLEFIELSREALPEVESMDEYAATESLRMENLPGSPDAASEVPARGYKWNPMTRLDMNARQASQVALSGAIAIVVGHQLSSTRYYWAVIAAFVMFTGTSTRSETFIKAVNRVIGTAVGLVVAIWLASMTAGHSGIALTVIIASMFCGFYLIRISYAYMIFFITIVIGQLYSILGQFSEGLLLIRLEETAVGAASGIIVALLVTPLSTRDTVRSVRDAFLESLSELLGAVADRLIDHERLDLDALSRALDNHARQLSVVARPLTRPLVWGNSSPLTRHRLRLYQILAAQSRTLIVGLRHTFPHHAEDVGAACRHLSGAAVEPSDNDRHELLREADELLLGIEATRHPHEQPAHVVRAVIRIHDVLVELSDRQTVRSAP